MSLTSTSTLAKESSIHLSPSKPQRTNAPPTNINVSRSKHPKNELNSWVHRTDAIASCFIRDIFTLEPNESNRKDPDFYWLGAVPCRTVKIVGMVVGVQVYEKRTMYTVDDGTSVIDCAYRHQLCKPPPKPSKPEAESSKYKRVEPAKISLEPPKPIAKVGNFVQVTGTIGHSFESKQIIVSELGLCSSSNDELLHTRTVRELHRTSYSSKHGFVIPPQPQKSVPQTPTKKQYNSNSMCSSPPSSVSSSPIKEPIYSSPTKTIPFKQPKQAPPKLRHPSRLHTHDLTANTFRIYVKYYMDCISDEDTPAFPTLSPQSDDTPRPSPRYRNRNDTTPRRIPRLDYGLGSSSSPSIPSYPPPSQATRKGFTLSYLRRVSELSLLASRVVDAVSKKRVREELKKMKERGMPPPCPMPSYKLSPEKKRAKMKELFRYAIIKHLQEGCIIIWDGPSRRCPDAPVEGVSELWRSNTSASTAGGNSTLFSTTLGPSFLTEGDDDEEMLSDPDPDEEAYVSLTPEFAADPVEEALRVIIERKEAARHPYAGATKDEILAELHNDDRWQHLGGWLVDDALQILNAEQRAYTSKGGRWHLTA